MIRKEDEMSTKIQRIRAICTAPEGINLVYVSQIRDAISYIMRK